jgi:hypothetical protein
MHQRDWSIFGGEPGGNLLSFSDQSSLTQNSDQSRRAKKCFLPVFFTSVTRRFLAAGKTVSEITRWTFL